MIPEHCSLAPEVPGLSPGVPGGGRKKLVRNSLAEENLRFAGTGGCSPENRDMGFLPAFFDGKSGRVYRSRYANGRPAPFHLLDGLPEALVVRSGATGRVTAVRPTVVSGFLRNGRFLTRAEAAAQAGPPD